MDRDIPYTGDEILQAQEREQEWYELIHNKMKTAVIKKCTFKNTWPTKRGETMFKHELEMDNGETGDINCKTQDPDFLKEGQTLSYASTSDKFGNHFTRIQPDKDKPSTGAFKTGQNWEDEPNRQKMIVNQSQIKNAMDFLNTHGWEGKTKQEKVKELTDYAEIFANWVMR